MWSKVATKHIDDETLDWLSTVAKHILDADKIEDGNDRKGALVNATGLRGAVNQQQASLVFALNCFRMSRQTDGSSRKDLRDFIASVMYFYGHADAAITKRVQPALTDAAIDKRVQRALESLGDEAEPLRAMIRGLK